MSNLGNITPSQGALVASPAAHALKQADEGIDVWLIDLVSGSGSSPSHIIVTDVLGVVPGIGQAMDLRDIVLGVIYISKAPAAVGGWVELVITLIGCVPAIGDTLKVGFKLMKQGHNFGRVLEGVSPKLRGNVEQYMRNINWGQITSESKNLFQKTLAAFIEGLDNWLVKAVVDARQAKLIVDELKGLQKQGPKMIDEAIGELKQMYSKMLAHELPGSTAAVAGTTSKVIREEAEQVAKQETKASARAQRKLQKKKSHDEKNNTASPNTTHNSDRKAANNKGSKNQRGVIAEHITDYYVKKTYRYPKENNHGRLTEEKDGNHHGLDHLWSHAANNAKPFVVGETKSSLFDSLPLILALPGEIADQFSAIRAEEKASPLPNKDPTKAKPNIYAENTGVKRDALGNQSSDLGGNVVKLSLSGTAA